MEPISTVARHSLILRHHRGIIVLALFVIEMLRVRRLPWHVYLSNKSPVLNLGRASSMQDFDVEIELYPVSQDPGMSTWHSARLLFIKFGKILHRSTDLRISSLTEEKHHG